MMNWTSIKCFFTGDGSSGGVIKYPECMRAVSVVSAFSGDKRMHYRNLR